MGLKLILRNLFAHKLRLFLTFGAVVLGVLLICISEAVVTSLSASVDQASSRRLWVQSAVSLYVSLPLSYQGKIESLEGVDNVCKFQWFGGVFRDADSFFAQFAVDSERLEAFYPEMELIEGSFEDFTRDRRGCLIGRGLAQQYGWKVGETVPILGTIFPRSDGDAWEFIVRGIYNSTSPATLDQNTLYFSYEYLRESQEAGSALGPEGVGVYVVQVAEGADDTGLMASVDELYENGPQRVQTTPESEFNRQFVTMLGNVPTLLRAVALAVLFAVFLAVLNTMLMAARERTHDIGIQKALGFDDGAIRRSLMTESLLIAITAGLVGAGLTKLLEAGLLMSVGKMFPGLSIGGEVLALGMGVAIGVGVLAGLIPAWRASRLTPVEALRADI